MKGKYNDLPVRLIRINVFPCSLDATECADAQTLSQFLLLPTNIQKSYDPSDKYDPVKSIPYYSEGITLDPTLLKTKEFTLRTNEIWDDDQDFFDEKLRATFVDVLQSNLDITQRVPANKIHCTV